MTTILMMMMLMIMITMIMLASVSVHNSLEREGGVGVGARCAHVRQAAFKIPRKSPWVGVSVSGGNQTCLCSCQTRPRDAQVCCVCNSVS